MEGLLQDLRDAVRQLRARPAFTVAVVGILGLGIGANTATFSLVSGLMLRPLPYADADTVVAVGHPAGDSGVAGAGRPVFPYLMTDELQQLQNGARSFEHHRGLPQRHCRYGHSERLRASFPAPR